MFTVYSIIESTRSGISNSSPVSPSNTLRTSEYWRVDAISSGVWEF